MSDELSHSVQHCSQEVQHSSSFHKPSMIVDDFTSVQIDCETVSADWKHNKKKK
jgi:hypothetical protein